MPKPNQTVDRVQIKSIYLGKISNIQSQTVKGYNQPTQSAIFADFYKTLFNWRPSQVSQYWSSNVFSGNVKEPPTVANDTAAIALTAKYKGVITYVTPQALSSSSSATYSCALSKRPVVSHYQPSTPSHNAPRFGSSTTTKPRAAASTNPSTTSSTTSATVPLSAAPMKRFHLSWLKFKRKQSHPPLRLLRPHRAMSLCGRPLLMVTSFHQAIMRQQLNNKYNYCYVISNLLRKC